MVDFSKLPDELIHIIINYTDIVVYRHGKYLNRIPKDDKRYNIIQKRRLPIWFSKNHWMFIFRFYDNVDKRAFEMEHIYNPRNNHHYLSKKELIKYDDGSIGVDKQTDYIFDLQGACRQIVNYEM
jgi:hypothetical protein